MWGTFFLGIATLWVPSAVVVGLHPRTRAKAFYLFPYSLFLNYVGQAVLSFLLLSRALPHPMLYGMAVVGAALMAYLLIAQMAVVGGMAERRSPETLLWLAAAAVVVQFDVLFVLWRQGFSEGAAYLRSPFDTCTVHKPDWDLVKQAMGRQMGDSKK